MQKLFALCALAAAAVLPSQSALARVDVGIGIGLPGRSMWPPPLCMRRRP